MTTDMEIVATEDPNMDREAKHALWKAIVRKAEQLRRNWGVSAFLSKDRSEPIADGASLPSCDIWKLVEILSVYTVLSNADEVMTTEVYNVRGRLAKPVFYRKDGEPYYLWTQVRMKESLSGFTGIPDIVITMTDEPPSRGNAIDIIESKSGRRITGPLIRAEFAKGFDLKVTSYFIWSFYDPPQGVIDGARQLGIEVTPLGFASAERHTVLDPEQLINRFAERLLNARNAGNFARMLQQTGSEASGKRQQRLR